MREIAPTPLRARERRGAARVEGAASPALVGTQAPSRKEPVSALVTCEEERTNNPSWRWPQLSWCPPQSPVNILDHL